MEAARIDRLLREAAGTPGLLSLAGGLPAPETFSRRAVAAAARQAILEQGVSPLQYDWPEGRLPLRELIASRLRALGAEVEAAGVIITNGAQDAIAIAADVLSPPAVQLDALTYPGALAIFRSRGCRVGVERAAVRYAMPALANPTGRVAGEAERDQILGSRWVIEDDAYAELCFAGRPRPPLLARAREQVFHVGTFSKTLLPGLRVGWLVPPPSWLKAVRDAKMRRDLHACGLAQAIVERFFALQNFDARLVRLRALYRRRCRRLCAALREIPRLRFREPEGGFSLWVETDCDASEEEWLRAALAAGVSFDPGSLFAVSGEASPCMRLSFSAIAEDRIGEAAARLASVVERQGPVVSAGLE